MTEFARWGDYFEGKEIARKRAENRAKGVVDFSDPQAAQQLIGMVASVGGGPRSSRAVEVEASRDAQRAAVKAARQ